MFADQHDRKAGRPAPAGAKFGGRLPNPLAKLGGGGFSVDPLCGHTVE
jgi:hypothetical protein